VDTLGRVDKDSGLGRTDESIQIRDSSTERVFDNCSRNKLYTSVVVYFYFSFRFSFAHHFFVLVYFIANFCVNLVLFFNTYLHNRVVTIHIILV